jgi:hypothetical protein
MNSDATIEMVLFFIHKKPYTFQINAELYSMVITTMAQNVMKQTRFIKQELVFCCITSTCTCCSIV